jgi:hypothetical protein
MLDIGGWLMSALLPELRPPEFGHRNSHRNSEFKICLLQALLKSFGPVIYIPNFAVLCSVEFDAKPLFEGESNRGNIVR